ncbi:phage tail protein I [Pseudomonas aeruginosa]|nr:phage tail protein I [Pseudomonas aeruginosa]MDI3811462.1 phage tail protein I [Pseudomonas aeruginosa]
MNAGSILPANLAALERDLDAALVRIGEIDIPIAVLWDPWKCPADVLPYLAWAVSVDQWRSDWPETIKRRVVAGSLGLHRIKGTRPAVVKALEALGVVVELTEWFEESPPAQPGTFSLVAWVNENLAPGEAAFLNAALYEQLLAAVRNAKNTRSWFTFKVGARFGLNRLGLAPAVVGLGAVARRDASAAQESLGSVGRVLSGASTESAAVLRRSGGLSINALPRTNVFPMGGAVDVAEIVRVSMEVAG